MASIILFPQERAAGEGVEDWEGEQRGYRDVATQGMVSLTSDSKSIGSQNTLAPDSAWSGWDRLN